VQRRSDSLQSVLENMQNNQDGSEDYWKIVWDKQFVDKRQFIRTLSPKKGVF